MPSTLRSGQPRLPWNTSTRLPELPYQVRIAAINESAVVQLQQQPSEPKNARCRHCTTKNKHCAVSSSHRLEEQGANSKRLQERANNHPGYLPTSVLLPDNNARESAVTRAIIERAVDSAVDKVMNGDNNVQHRDNSPNMIVTHFDIEADDAFEDDYANVKGGKQPFYTSQQAGTSFNIRSTPLTATDTSSRTHNIAFEGNLSSMREEYVARRRALVEIQQRVELEIQFLQSTARDLQQRVRVAVVHRFVLGF